MPLLFWVFSEFITFILGPISYYPREPIMGKGNSPNFKIGWDLGVSVPGWFNLDHLHPFKPHLFQKCFKFFTFILGGQYNYPRGLIMGKGNSPNSKTEWDRGFSVPGAFKLDHLQAMKPLLFPDFSNFFTFILGGQFLLPQRANNGKWEFTQLQNWMRQGGFGAWGIHTWSFAEPICKSLCHFRNPLWPTERIWNVAKRPEVTVLSPLSANMNRDGRRIGCYGTQSYSGRL